MTEYGLHDLNTADDSGDADLAWQFHPDVMTRSGYFNRQSTNGVGDGSITNPVDGLTWGVVTYPNGSGIVQANGIVEHTNYKAGILAQVNPFDPPPAELVTGHFG